MASASRFFALLLALATFGCAQEAQSPPRLRHRGTGLSRDRFIVGAWCSPPTNANAETWWRFYRAGNSVAVRALEDPNDRARNLATLELLDSFLYTPMDTAGIMPPPMTLLVRDGAVHPDEPSRPGWRDRVREVVHAYREHSSLAGYFVADEPSGAKAFDQVAQVCAAFSEEDTVHPAYVNLLPIAGSASPEAQAAWRAATTRLIEKGRLRLFSFDAYSQGPKGEDAGLLLTLANAARVSRETGCPFIVVLQFTGFGPHDPMSFAQLQYEAAEAVAHGASGIVWFTYWTPDPQESGMRWRGGAVGYDGSWTTRADTMATVGGRARELARAFRGQAARITHPGGAWPWGAPLLEQSIEGLAGTEGGPITIAAGESADASHIRKWLVINRDRARSRHVRLRLAPTISARTIQDQNPRPPFGVEFVNPSTRTIELDLAPGGSALVEFAPA